MEPDLNVRVKSRIISLSIRNVNTSLSGEHKHKCD